MPGTTINGGDFAVLEDPTGKRARWMRRAGRVVFLFFLVWLVAIVLGGLGLVPVAGIPLTQALRPSQGPAPVSKVLKVKQPTASDLKPAVPARVFDAETAQASRLAKHRAAVAHAKSVSASGHTKTTAVKTVTHGKSTVAPGQTKTTTTVPAGVHGKKTVAPGHTKTATTATTTTGPAGVHGKKPAVAPGRTRTTTTTTTTTTATTTTTTTVPTGAHGSSSVAPGRVKNP